MIGTKAYGNLFSIVTKVTTDQGDRSSNARQLGYAFHKPPKSISPMNSDMQKPIQRVKFTKPFARHTKIRDQNPSLGYICPGEFHQQSNAPKFEDRSQEETKWQERWAREAAWRLAKKVLKLKEHEGATFFFFFLFFFDTHSSDEHSVKRNRQNTQPFSRGP